MAEIEQMFMHGLKSANASSALKDYYCSLDNPVWDWFRYKNRSEYVHVVRMEKLRRLTADLRGTMIDVGCADGYLAELLASSATDRQVIGIDVSNCALLKANINKPYRLRTQLDYVSGDICDLPISDGEADAVLCCETLEHILDPVAALNELRRILKPYGTLIVSVPTVTLWELFQYLVGFGKEIHWEHFREYWGLNWRSEKLHPISELINQLQRDMEICRMEATSLIDFPFSDRALKSWFVKKNFIESILFSVDEYFSRRFPKIGHSILIKCSRNP